MPTQTRARGKREADTDLPPRHSNVDEATQSARDAAAKATDYASATLASASETASGALASAQKAANDMYASASDSASKALAQAQVTASATLNSAKESASSALESAKTSASGTYTSAMKTATSTLDSAKETVTTTAATASNKIQKTHRSAMSTMASPGVLPEAMAKLVPESSIHVRPFLDAILADHKEILAFYDKWYECTEKNDMKEAQQWMNQFTWELARHSVAEELILYPLMEERLGERGRQLADEARQEHQASKEDMKTLESMAMGTEEYNAKVDKMVAELKAHITKEETVDLPPIMEVLSETEKKHYGILFEKTKKFVPTRPHPSFPDRPPYETAVGLLAAPVDKLKDLFRSFPDPEVVEKVEE